MPKNMRDKFTKNQTLKSNKSNKSNSVSFIISSHLSQFRRIHTIFPTNLSLEKLLTPSHTKTPRKKTFSLRPPNGFILYRKDVQQEIIKNNPDATFEVVSTTASKKWKCEPEEKKKFFNSLSKVAHLVYLDVCENYAEQNEKDINFNLYEVEKNKDTDKHLDRPWMQSSIFPTMLVSPNSFYREKSKSQEIEIERNDDDDKSTPTLNQSFYDDDFIEVPSISSPHNILDDIEQSIFHSPSICTSFFSNSNEDSVGYDNLQTANYLEIPYIPDFLLNNNNNDINDNTYQMPPQLYDFDYGNTDLFKDII